MNLWPFLKSHSPPSLAGGGDSGEAGMVSPYVGEYLAAFDRTEKFGFEALPRILVQKDCVVMTAVMPVLLDYFEANGWEALQGQTAAIHFALVPLLADTTGIPFNLTIGWIERHGKPIYRHDESLVQRFIDDKTEAWLREGLSVPLVADLTGVRNTRCHVRDESRVGEHAGGVCCLDRLSAG